MEGLLLKVKNELVKKLLSFTDRLDDDYLHAGQKTYTRREIATEIENETEFGIQWLTTSIEVTLDTLARQSKK